MKKLLLLLFSLMLSFNSYGEWTKVNENTSDDSYYIDFQTVKPFTKKIMGEDYVVWWEMRDLSEPTDDGKMSSQIYYKGDCEQTRTKFLSMISFTGNMGTGNSEDLSGGFVNLEDLMGWTYPPSDSVTYDNLRIVCLLAEHYSKSDYESNLQEFIDKFGSTDWEDDVPSNEYVLSEANEELIMLQNAYINNIAARIKTFWRYQSAEDDWSAEVYVVQDRDGNVKAVDVKNANVGNSSFGKSFMDSIERAVYKASPFPAAPDDAVFDSELYITFTVK